MNEIVIPIDYKQPVKFFSKYHNANLYLNISGFFRAETENSEVIKNFKKYIEIIRPDFISALQSALTVISEKENIYELLANPQIFDKINSFMQICLEDSEDFHFICIVPQKLAFDKESISVIRISEQIKNSQQPQINLNKSENSDNSWKCIECGCINYSKFCMDCGTAKPEIWECSCGAKNSKAFC